MPTSCSLRLDCSDGTRAVEDEGGGFQVRCWCDRNGSVMHSAAKDWTAQHCSALPICQGVEARFSCLSEVVCGCRETAEELEVSGPVQRYRYQTEAVAACT
jgi:hypothetical protein